MSTTTTTNKAVTGEGDAPRASLIPQMNSGSACHRIRGIKNIVIVFDYVTDIFHVYKEHVGHTRTHLEEIAQCSTASQAKAIAKAERHNIK